MAAAHMGSLGVETAALISQQYRRAIRRVLKSLAIAPTQLQNQAATEALLSANLIWSLFESVTLRPSDHPIVADLMEWGGECFTASAAADTYRQVMDEIEQLHTGGVVGDGSQGGKPERLDRYWTAVIQQVLVAEYPAAVSLLKCHSKYRSDRAFQKMTQLLQELHDAYSQLRRGGGGMGG